MIWSAPLLLLASLTAVLAVPLPPNATSGATPFALEDYLLPKSIFPSSYDISIIPYFENAPSDDLKFRFRGVCKITFRVLETTSVIRLHANDMDLLPGVTVTALGVANGDRTVRGVKIGTDDRHFFDIEMDGFLVQNPRNFYELTIQYIGKLNDELEGFYRSSYVNYRGDTVWLGITQFEQTAARRAFPCFDEPAMKAKYTLHIAREPLRDVTANMPVQLANRPVEGHTGWVWMDFEQTITMSPYLVAFAVHDFGSVSATSADGQVAFKVLARKEFIDSSSAYANNVTPQLLNFFEDYTGVLYDRKMKVDQIALPDFAAGAMENWGLITYREVNLLHDKFFSTTANKQRILTVIAHELAHQWFGNLVTADWWSEIWLNEGFATFFEYFGADKIDALFQLELAFIKDELHTVFKSDSLDSTHPLTTPVDNPASAAAAFDNIAYNKGAVIVRFLETTLGKQNFKLGVQKYLQRNSYSTGTKEKLWESLSEHIEANTLPLGVDLPTVMNTWTEQSGYPVITVTRNYEKKEINFEQERFHSSKKNTPGPEKWYVPITMVPESNGDWQDFRIKGWLLPNRVLTLTSNVPNNTEWIILNPRQTGYYRVNYDEENWKKIIATLNDEIKWQIITEINRAQIMDDSMALAKGKYLNYTVALETTEYLNKEYQFLPWSTALSAFNFIGDRLIDEANDRRQFFQMYMLDKLRPIYKTLGGFQVSEADSNIVRMNRALILRWACNLGHEECSINAREFFQEWKNRSSPDFQNPIDPDLRSVVYCHGMKDAADFDFLFTRYTKAQSMPSEMSTLLTSLGCAPTPELLKRVLDETIKERDSKIRSQDTRTAFISVINNPMGINVALDFLVTEFEKIKITYKAFGSVTRLFNEIAPKLNTVAQNEKLKKFLTDNPTEPDIIKQAVESAIAVVDENIAWLTANKDLVLDFFEEKVKSGAQIALISPIIMLCAALLINWL